MKKIPVRSITSAKEQTLGRFSIRQLKDLLNGKDLQHPLHRHSFFFILLLQQGGGVHEIDFTPHPVTDQSIFLLRPGQVHQLQLAARATGYLIEFDTAFYHPTDKNSAQRLQKAISKNYCEFEENRFQKLQAIVAQICEEYSNREEGYMDSIKANLEIFFIEFVRQSSTPTSMSTNVSSYTQERFEEFLASLEKNVTTHKRVAQYAGMMVLSAYQLNEITKASVGKSPSDLINEQIVLEAKRYLLASTNQVKDIADHLGYEDVSYFIRFFKKHTSFSPEVFRYKPA